MSASPRLVIFPTDSTYLLGTCPLGLVKKIETGMYRDELESCCCPCSFLSFRLRHLQLCQTFAWKLLECLGGRITQTFEIIKLLSKKWENHYRNLIKIISPHLLPIFVRRGDLILIRLIICVRIENIFIFCTKHCFATTLTLFWIVLSY